jgi:hypothetical protein
VGAARVECSGATRRPEDIPADEIQSWDDVVRRWGGGEYQAIGMDEQLSIVAWHPPLERPWMRFEQEPMPFMPSTAACALADTSPPPPPVAAPGAPALPVPEAELAAWITANVDMTRAATEEIKAQRELINAQRDLIHAQRDLVVELVKALSEQRSGRSQQHTRKAGAPRRAVAQHRGSRAGRRRRLG